jgi:integrase
MSLSRRIKRRQNGSIRRLPSGRYQARHTDRDGQRHVKTHSTKGDADAWLAIQQSDQIRGSWVDPKAGSVSLNQYSEDWLAHKTNLAPRTRELYSDQLRLQIQPVLGPTEIGRLTSGAVRAWFAGMVSKYGEQSPTPAKCYRLLSQIMKVAQSDGLILRNPCAIKGASIERAPERPVASVDQVWALADAINPRYRLLVLLAGWCGLRRGELVALRRDRIDLGNHTISVEEAVKELKSGKRLIGNPKSAAGRRRIAIPANLVEEIVTHLDAYVGDAEDSFVFTGPQCADSLRYGTLYAAWHKAVVAVGMTGFRLHDLRHTAGTLAATTGASTSELMLRLGHSTPQAALRYQHATAQRDREIAGRLDEMMVRPALLGVDHESVPSDLAS